MPGFLLSVFSKMSSFLADNTPLNEALRQYRLLAYCARVYCDESHYPRIVQLASEVTNWSKLLDQAEVHGLSPLLYTHFYSAGVDLSLSAKQTLQGLYLRQ